ncbi:PorV/PorQ family protein [bacterium]
MKKILILLVIISSCVSIIFAGGKGTAGAAFLSIDNGARPTSMGGAFTSIADDVNTINYNPAGLASIGNVEVMFVRNQWLEDIESSMFSGAYKIKPELGVGLVYKEMSYGQMEEKDDRGNTLGKTFDGGTRLITLGAGYKLHKKDLYVGLNLKYISEKLYVEKASAYACDLGVLYKLNKEIKIGASLLNLGNKIKLYKEGFNIPRTYKIGGSYSFEKNKIVSLEFENNIENNFKVRLGGEYFLYKMIFLRGGYIFESNEIDSNLPVSLGLGFIYHDLYIDYAYLPKGDLGDTHKVSVMMKFGKKHRKRTKRFRKKYKTT